MSAMDCIYGVKKEGCRMLFWTILEVYKLLDTEPLLFRHLFIKYAPHIQCT